MTTSQQPATTGGLCGSTKTTNQPSGGGLFGNTQPTTTNTGGGLFGGGTMTGQSTSGGGLLGGNQAEPAVEACLGVRRPPRRMLKTYSGVAGFFGSSTIGTSTVGNGQQPQQQQLPTGSLLSSRSAGGLGQQQNDPASQHANITARFEGIYNAWNPASLQCRVQV